MLSAKVSVVMPVFNGEKYLHESIGSILSQTFRDFEFIIINDGSMDKTETILNKYQTLDPRIQVIQQPNRGVVNSLNRGCQLSTGQYIARMDADDIALDTRLERQLEFLERHPRVGLLGTAVNVVNDKNTAIGVISYVTDDDAIRRALKQSNCFIHPTVMMRKAVFDSVGGYRSEFLHAEEYDLWLRIMEIYELGNLAETLLSYRVHSTQITFRHLRQQIISVLGAQLAARVREDGGRDPIWRNGHVSLADLQKHGIDEKRVDRMMVEGLSFWISLFLSGGDTKGALNLVESWAAILPTDERARVHWAHARNCYADSRLLATLTETIKACRAKPKLIFDVLQSVAIKFSKAMHSSREQPRL